MQVSRVLNPLGIPHLIEQCMKSSLLSKVRFSRVYPNGTVDRPTIVWRLVRRVLGKEGKETKGPRIRGVDPSSPDNLTIFWGQWTTAVFQFDIIAPSEEEADEIMERFELFAVECRAILQAAGVDTFIFQEQLQDYSLPIPKDIPQRSVRYEATMTTLYPIYQPRIHQIALSVASGCSTDSRTQVRGDGPSDAIDIPIERISGIGASADTTDYIVGVDYDLADNGDDTATVTWLEHGLHPQAGSPYYIQYSTLADPMRLVVTG